MEYINRWLSRDPETHRFVGEPRPELDEAWHELLEGKEASRTRGTAHFLMIERETKDLNKKKLNKCHIYTKRHYYDGKTYEQTSDSGNVAT